MLGKGKLWRGEDWGEMGRAGSFGGISPGVQVDYIKERGRRAQEGRREKGENETT